MTYQVFIPHAHAEATDKAIQSYLDANPQCILEDAVEEIFQLGVRTFNALAEKPTEEVEHVNLYP